MVQLLRISEETSLEKLEQDFLLQPNDDRNFFLEWQQDLPNLTESDRENLQRITELYDRINRRSVVSENIIKMSMRICTGLSMKHYLEQEKIIGWCCRFS
jgi:hypothetical protein